MGMYDRDWYRAERKAQRAVQAQPKEPIAPKAQRRSVSAMTIISGLTIILVVTVIIGLLK